MSEGTAVLKSIFLLLAIYVVLSLLATVATTAGDGNAAAISPLSLLLSMSYRLHAKTLLFSVWSCRPPSRCQGLGLASLSGRLHPQNFVLVQTMSHPRGLDAATRNIARLRVNMSVDPKFIELAADVFIMIFIK